MSSPSTSQPRTGGVRAWIDRRTGLDRLMRAALDEPVPGGARFAYVFGSGLLFLFVSQVITGLCLALYYVPSAESAHTTVAFIAKKVTGGEFIRSIHVYGASAMIVVLALHLLQTVTYGAYKRRRELLWLSGIVLASLVLAMAFTGYLLPWDERAYFATSVGTNIMGEIPFIGNAVERFMRGGDVLGTLTLSRFYFAHILLIPGLIFAFIATHVFLFRKAGAAGPVSVTSEAAAKSLPAQPFYPRQVIYDMAFAGIVIVALFLLADLYPAGLGRMADPSNTQFLPRPEWYFLPMFQWLKVWESHPIVGIFVVPGILATLFALLPFLDRRPERRPWRRPVAVGSVFIVLLGGIFLGALSKYQDNHTASVREQLQIQDQQAADFMKAPFQPQMSAGAAAIAAAASQSKTAAAAANNPAVAAGLKLYQSKGCIACHGPNGSGTPIAIALAKVAQTTPAATIRHDLQHYTPLMKSKGMPPFTFTNTELDDLVSYITSLK